MDEFRTVERRFMRRRMSLTGIHPEEPYWQGGRLLSLRLLRLQPQTMLRDTGTGRRMHPSIAILVLVALLASCGQTEGAAPEMHRCMISGLVVDQSGDPVEAVIGIRPRPDPYSDIGYSADESGQFEIGVDCGTRYTLWAAWDEAVGEETDVMVEEGERVVELVLPRSGD